MELGIDNNTLIIKGTTVLRFSHKDKRDRSRRSFHRYIELPVSVNADGATAKIKHGLLTIVLPKVKESNAKKITIQE